MTLAEEMNKEAGNTTNKEKYPFEFFEDLVFHKTATTFSGEIGIASTMHHFFHIANETGRQDVIDFLLSEPHKFLKRSKSKYSIMLTKAIGNTHGDGVIILILQDGKFTYQKWWSTREPWKGYPISNYVFGHMDEREVLNG